MLQKGLRSAQGIVSGYARRKMSTAAGKPSILEGDLGKLGTHTHHKVTSFLAVATPVMFLLPDSTTDGMAGKAFGVLLAGNVATHGWVGLNYVVRDYAPKISKSLLGPGRVLCAGVGLITFLGMTRVAVSSPGGIKACVKGLWSPPQEDEKKK